MTLVTALAAPVEEKNNIRTGSTATAPILFRGSVNHHLCRSHGVHRGHESRLNAESVVDALHHRCKTIRGA